MSPIVTKHISFYFCHQRVSLYDTTQIYGNDILSILVFLFTSSTKFITLKATNHKIKFYVTIQNYTRHSLYIKGSNALFYL